MDDQNQDLRNHLNLSDKGSDCVVVVLGSHSLKFGLASQFQPFIIPNVIAYRKKEYEEDMDLDGDLEVKIDNGELNEAFYTQLGNLEANTIKKLQKLEQRNKLKKGMVPSNNQKSSIKYYDSTNCESDLPERKMFEQPVNSTASYKKIVAITQDLNEDVVENSYKWTATSDCPSFLVGREALTINDIGNYQFHWPIVYGNFNQKLSYFSVLNDVKNIVEWALAKVLQLSKSEISTYNVVLTIPDVFVKTQVKGLMQVFLNMIGFKSIFVHTESPMNTYGAALQSACVVDIGATKTSVCCVDEGIVLEETLIKKNYGGDDVTKLFFHSLTKKGSKNYFPSDYFNIENPYHFRIFEKLKEQDCEFPNIQVPNSQFVPKNLRFWLHRRELSTKVFNIIASESLYLPPLGLFNPLIFETIRNLDIPALNPYNDIYSEVFNDPEDIFIEFVDMINQDAAKKEGGQDREKDRDREKDKEKDKITIEKNSLGLVLSEASAVKKEKGEKDEDTLSVSNSRSEESQSEEKKNPALNLRRNTYENQFKFQGLDEIITASIMSISNSEIRKKLSNQILLTGGGCKTKGLIDYIEDKLIDKLTDLDPEVDRIECIQIPNADLRTVSWIGASIIPKIDSSRDMWISRERFLCEVEKSEEKEQLVTEEGKEIQVSKGKKKEKHFDGGIKVLREKAMFNIY